MSARELYRPCPMCRTQLEGVILKGVIGDDFKGWKFYNCPNCGSTVFINPFARVKESK